MLIPQSLAALLRPLPPQRKITQVPVRIRLNPVLAFALLTRAGRATNPAPRTPPTPPRRAADQSIHSFFKQRLAI